MNEVKACDTPKPDRSLRAGMILKGNVTGDFFLVTERHTLVDLSRGRILTVQSDGWRTRYTQHRCVTLTSL